MSMFDPGQNGRLFLAIRPDAETAARIYRMAEILKHAHRFRGRLTARDRLHVTLLPLSGLPREAVGRACDAIGEMKAAAFRISFDRTMSFKGRPGSRPFVLAGDHGVARLKAYRLSLAACLHDAGLARLGRRDFTPHVTLLFGDRAVEEHPIGPVGWTVRSLVLIHSMNGHRRLAEWPLHV